MRADIHFLNVQIHVFFMYFYNYIIIINFHHTDVSLNIIHFAAIAQKTPGC